MSPNFKKVKFKLYYRIAIRKKYVMHMYLLMSLIPSFLHKYKFAHL